MRTVIMLTLLCARLACVEDQFGTLFEAGKYAEAAAYAKKALETDKANAGLMYNGGMAAYLAGDYQVSLEFWIPLMAIEVDNIKLKAKLIQSYEALGDKQNAGKQIADIYQMYQNRKGKEYEAIRFFTRDQFQVDGKRVMVFEYFELSGDRAVKYSFNVLNKAGETDYKLSLGSYDVTDGFMQSQEKLPGGMRYHHLDGYYDKGASHRTYGFYKGAPDYAVLKETVKGIIMGKIEAVSGTDAK